MSVDLPGVVGSIRGGPGRRWVYLSLLVFRPQGRGGGPERTRTECPRVSPGMGEGPDGERDSPTQEEGCVRQVLRWTLPVQPLPPLEPTRVVRGGGRGYP